MYLKRLNQLAFCAVREFLARINSLELSKSEKFHSLKVKVKALKENIDYYESIFDSIS